MATTPTQNVNSKTAHMETSCLMNAFRVASYADSKYKVPAFQGRFSVILEPNEMRLYILLSKVMLATASPAIMHSVAARWPIRSIPQHPLHDLQAAGESENNMLIVPSSLPSTAQCLDTGQLLEERLPQAVFRSTPSSTIMQKAESRWRL